MSLNNNQFNSNCKLQSENARNALQTYLFSYHLRDGKSDFTCDSAETGNVPDHAECLQIQSTTLPEKGNGDDVEIPLSTSVLKVARTNPR